MPLRLVLDSNVWLDWLVFDDPSVASIKEAVQSRQAQIFISPLCADELRRVLTYRLRKQILDPAFQAACMDECRRHATPIAHVSGLDKRLPVCSDSDDQKFLELASTCQANFLVTKDAALLKLNGSKRTINFRIITPVQFAL